MNNSKQRRKKRCKRRALNEKEVAKRLDVAVTTLQKWRQQGIGPLFMKLSARVSYPEEHLEDYERQALRKSTSERA